MVGNGLVILDKVVGHDKSKDVVIVYDGLTGGLNNEGVVVEYQILNSC